MLIYSNPFYIEDNGNGYDLDLRDAICRNCLKVLGRQENYRDIDEKFKFPEREKNEYKFCPYCGEELYG